MNGHICVKWATSRIGESGIQGRTTRVNESHVKHDVSHTSSTDIQSVWRWIDVSHNLVVVARSGECSVGLMSSRDLDYDACSACTSFVIHISVPIFSVPSIWSRLWLHGMYFCQKSFNECYHRLILEQISMPQLCSSPFMLVKTAERVSWLLL